MEICSVTRMRIGQVIGMTAIPLQETCFRWQVEQWTCFKSTEQATAALTTAEAEYVALNTATQEVIWFRQLLTDLGESPKNRL